MRIQANFRGQVGAVRPSARGMDCVSVLVKQLRLKKELSQEKAAALAGVGRRFFSELERGEKESLDLGKVLQVLRKFGVKITLEAKLHDEL